MNNKNKITPYSVQFAPEIIFGSDRYEMNVNAGRKVTAYESGKKTDKEIGVRLIGTNANGQEISVKVLYEDVPTLPIPGLTSGSVQDTVVRFDDITVKVYVNNYGRAEFAVQAKKAEVVKL